MQNMLIIDVQQTDVWLETTIGRKDCWWVCRYQLACYGDLVLWSLVQAIL
jgi:hypothetical protein